MPRARRPRSHPFDCGCAICGKVLEEAAGDRRQAIALLDEQAKVEDGTTYFQQERARLYRYARDIVVQSAQSSPSPTLELKPQTPTTGINAVIGQMPELASPSEPLAWLILTCHGTRWAVDLSEMDAEQRCRRLNASDSGAYQHCKPFRVVLLVQLENA